MTILVTAAYGTQGRMLIPRLAKAGAKVRAMRASAGKEMELLNLGAAEALTGDASDPAVLRDAMKGVTSVYHVGPSAHPRELPMGMAVVEAAREAGVQHLVFSSVLHAILTGLIQHAIKRDIEEALINSGVNFTILQPADYMQVQRVRRAFETGQFELAWTLERRQSVVDVRDITEVAAKVLLEGEPHFGATYELCAPGCFTAHEIAALIETACGRPIRAMEVNPEQRMKDQFAASATPASQHSLRVYQALRSWYSAHDFVGNSNVLRMLLGREPTSLAQHIDLEYAAFRADQSTGR